MTRAMNTQCMDKVAFKIQNAPIDVSPLLQGQNDEGALLLFIGLVRDFNKERDGVTKIKYECYREMAEQEGLRILEQARQKFDVSRILCVHRVGELELQEIAIHLEIRSAHRLPSLRACEYIMDEIKTDVPIWKKEFYGKTGEWL